MNNTYLAIKQRGVNTKEFIERHYNIEFKNNKARCPFHEEKTSSFTYQQKNNFVHCFGCSSGGDAISFVEKFEKLSNYEASKRVCELENIEYEESDNTKELSEEEKKQRELKHTQAVEELKKKKLKEQEEENKLRQKAKQQMSKVAPTYLADFKNFYGTIHQDIAKIFPNQTEIFNEWANYYLGYDSRQNSVVTINRYKDEFFNIKHRTKKKQDGSDYEGKWIGWYKGSRHPFPLEYYLQHKSDAVVLVEGEKDSLNLLSYDINNITLGGVSNTWEHNKELLKDKIVYIWFDHDKAGYENAIKKYYELKSIARDVFVVLFYHIDADIPKGYDISDFLYEKQFTNKKEIFHAISYSTYRLTNSLIDDMGEFCDKDFSNYHELAPYKDFRDIKREWSKTDQDGNAYNIFTIVGELDDEEVDKFLQDLKKSKKIVGSNNESDYEHFRNICINSVLVGRDDKAQMIENMENTFDRFMNIKKILLTNYRQTHIVDALRAFLKMAKKSGNTFAKYQGNLYIWTGTHYECLDNLDALTTWIHNIWFFHARFDIKKQTKRNIDEIVENIMSKAYDIDETRRYEERRVMNFLNGTLKISKRGKYTFVESHNKKDCATNILKFNYNKNATAPKWKKFLNRVLPDKQDQQTLMEFIGYTLAPTHNYESFMFLYGKSGANGKSVILDVIRAFFGEDNTSSLQLQQFFDHQLSSLQNKIINIGSEIDAKGLDKGQLATLKALVSPKDSIQINPKNKEPYQLKPNEKPKLIFAGNDKPKGSDVDSAVFRRMLLLNFDAEIKDDEKIRDLSDRFKDEMAGILNMTLEALTVLVKNGKFSRSDKMKGEIEAYKDEINPMRTFVKDTLKVDNSCMVAKPFVYHFYKEWASEKGFKPYSEINFWRKIKDELPNIETTGKQIRLATSYFGIERPRFVLNITLQNNEFKSFRYNNIEIPVNEITLSNEKPHDVVIFEQNSD